MPIPAPPAATEPEPEPDDEVLWMATAIETLAVVAAFLFALAQAR